MIKIGPLVLMSLTLLWAVSAPAQSIGVRRLNRPDKPARAEAGRQARSLIAAGKLDDAEVAIRALTPSSPDSAQGKIEAAQRFMQMANQLAATGRTDQIRPTIERALRLLANAVRQTRSPALKASALSMAGFLSERYLGDEEAAEEHYRAAVILNPADKNLKRRSDRAEKIADTRRRRDRDKRGGRP